MHREKAMFQGIFCPSITITKKDGSIDRDLWARHLDHLIQAGIDGVLLFGSIGEFYAFSTETRKEAMEFAIRHVAGRIKVFVGVGDTDPDRVIELTAFAEQCGADAIVAICPYYFGPSQDCARRYYTSLAQSTRMPIILYNFPARTGMDLSPELVADLAAHHKNIVGIKDTVDNISHTRKIVAAVRPVSPSFSVFSGFDEYYTVNRICGGNGVLSGLTNVEPETFTTLHRAYEEGDFNQVMTSAQRINHLMAIYDAADLFVSAIKGAVKLKGLPISTDIREPAVQVSDDQMEKIKHILES